MSGPRSQRRRPQPTPSRRSSRPSAGRKIFVTLGVLVLLGAVVMGVGKWLNSGDDGALLPPPPGAEDGAQQMPGQPADCPAVEVISAPGTWESSPTDDPIHPHEKPFALLLKATEPLQQRFGEDQVKVWTLPYTAQFRNLNAQQEMSYDDSRTEGFNKVNEELRATHEHCPQTGFILTGFSQGAVLIGDIVSDIGNGRGVIPAANVLGTTLVADGRRVPGSGVIVGNQPQGVGAEVALAPVNALVQPIVPGATMRGPRPGGFGELNDRTNQICAANDHICDTPQNIDAAAQRALAIVANNGIHAQYATNTSVIDGTTAPQWIVQWATDLINRQLKN